MRLTRRALLGGAAGASALPATSRSFAQQGFQTPLISDTVARPVGISPKPPYLVPMRDPVFGTKITRISGDPGNVILNVPGGTWGQCARHHYSLDQAWNADQSLLYLDTNVDPDNLSLTGSAGASGHVGGPKGHLFLDGQTYLPRFHQEPPGGNNSDIRWHVSEPSLMYYVHDAEFGLWNSINNRTKIIQKFAEYSQILFGTSPTGDRVMFASNWGDPYGNGRPVQAYVCDLRDGPGLLT